MKKKILRVILGFAAALPGIFMVLLGILFLAQPEQAAFRLDMKLLDGIGRSIQIGAFCLFFFGTAVLILLGAIRSRSRWLYAGAMFIGGMAALRILAALIHGSGMTTESIVYALVMTCWLCVCAFLIDEKKNPKLIRIGLIACAVMAAGVYIFTRPIPFEGTTLTQPRKQLAFEQLQESRTPHLLHMSYLAKPEWGQKAFNRFSGSLTFVETRMTTRLNDITSHGGGQTLFPSFSVDLVSDGDVLIPRQKGIISTWQSGESFWDVVVGTGKIWKEAGDKGWDRASFPITLVSRKAGQVKNCVGSFLYSQKRVSNIYVQCSQETSPKDDSQVGDMLVTLPAEYQPRTFEDSEKIIHKYYKTTAARLPIYPLDKVDSEGKVALLFDDDNAWTSLGALVIDGNVYLHPPKTRHGNYPYPHEMRHGVFSVTKSLAGALSMFYLAQRYGEEIFDERITDYVPGLADHPGWQGVTFSHVLNMVTGTEGGDHGNLITPLLFSPSAEEGIKTISNLGDSPEAPGEKSNYASTNTFVLSYAMQKYVEKKEGKGVYYWDLVRENVLKPIKADYLALQHTEESDGSKGIPTLGWGAFPTIDETAKIALLLSNEGEYMGQQLLHKGKIREALNRTEWRGYVAYPSRNNHPRNYSHSFWSHDVRNAKCKLKILYMLGHGGSYVTFLPSNAVLIRFMDKMDYYIDPLVLAVEEIRTSCK
jgi:CubicO group peptidase (beta-lactamase class C family)